MTVKMTRLIAGALVVSATIVLVAVAIIRHVNHKQDVAWCYDHGYAATREVAMAEFVRRWRRE